MPATAVMAVRPWKTSDAWYLCVRARGIDVHRAGSLASSLATLIDRPDPAAAQALLLTSAATRGPCPGPGGRSLRGRGRTIDVFGLAHPFAG